MLKDNDILMTLMRRVASGDEAAFEQLVTAFEAPVYNLAYSGLRHRQDAEDVTQEVFLRLWRTRGDFRGECSVRTYVMHIAHNVITDSLRRRTSRAVTDLPDDIDDDEAPRRELADSTDLQAEYIQREREEAVRRAINSLEPDTRELIIMRDINGMSYADIAVATGVPMGTVKSRLSRARDQLKEFLKKGNFFV